MKRKKITYAQAGVKYKAMDPLKRMAQARAKQTARNLDSSGYKEVGASRGESAYVWSFDSAQDKDLDFYLASVIEGLGTKNLVADKMREITGKTYYDHLAQDTVAMIVNDIIVVGAKPLVINAYFAAGNSDWFKDKKRVKNLVEGWAKACDLAGAVWGGGETPTLKGIIKEEAIDLSGSCVGFIKPKERLVLGDKLKPGDCILLVSSSGIHANGLTLARAVGDRLPHGYATKLPSGKLYGEALLKPTYIYAKLVQDLFEVGVEIHYMVNITGHGWRKIMRAKRDFTYVVERLPEVPEELSLIQKISRNDDKEMYGNFNMGAGFAIYLPKKDVPRAQKIIKRNGFGGLEAGFVKKGKRQVIIQPKKIVYKSQALELR